MNTQLIQFTLLIPVKSRLREFNFRQRSPEWYDGNTTDERGERYYFKWIRERDRWQFAGELLPGWLLESEAQVTQAMEKRDA